VPTDITALVLEARGKIAPTMTVQIRWLISDDNFRSLNSLSLEFQTAGV
jgi:hypothetical protein